MRMMQRTPIGLMCTFLAVGCGGGGAQPRSSSRDSAGVQIKAVERNERPLKWRADTVRLLGGAESGFQSFYRVRNALVDVDPAARIYVLDQIARRVVVFDSSGAFVKSMGRKGGGPGELQDPLAVAVSNAGEVVVHDMSKGALVRFDSSGRALPEVQFPAATIHIYLRQVDVVDAAFVVWMRDLYIGTDDRRTRLLWIGGRDTVDLVSLGIGRTSTAPYPKCGMTFTTTVPLSPFIYWSQSGKRVAVAAWGDDRIDVFDDDHMAFSLRLGPRRSTISEGEAIKQLEAFGYHGPCGASPRVAVRKHGFYPLPQHIRAVAVAPDGALWVKRITSRGNLRIDVLDATGTPVGVLPGTFPMPVAFLPDGRPLIQVRDSLDVERLGVVRLRS